MTSFSVFIFGPFLVSVIFIANLSFGGEVDNFTYRPPKAADNSDLTNKLVHDHINRAIRSMRYGRSETQECDREQLMERLEVTLDTNFPDIYSDLSYQAKDVVNPHPLSIYKKEFGFLDGLAPAINIDGHWVGTDKVDHFFSSGLAYYKIVKAGKGIEKALGFGAAQEDGTWGLAGVGVKSYGDLAANYAGMTFWQQVFDGDNPYIKCIEGRWKLVRRFDIREYVDDSWDEAINCSSFSSIEKRDAVFKDLKQKKVGSCPLKPKSCESLKAKYSATVARSILHPRCYSLDSNHTFVEAPKARSIKNILQAVTGARLGNVLKGVFGLDPERMNRIQPGKGGMLENIGSERKSKGGVTR